MSVIILWTCHVNRDVFFKHTFVKIVSRETYFISMSIMLEVKKACLNRIFSGHVLFRKLPTRFIVNVNCKRINFYRLDVKTLSLGDIRQTTLKNHPHITYILYRFTFYTQKSYKTIVNLNKNLVATYIITFCERLSHKA